MTSALASTLADASKNPPALTGQEPAPVLVMVEQAAMMLGIGRTTTYELIANGDLEAVHIGRLTRVPIVAIDDLVDRLRGGVSPRSDTGPPGDPTGTLMTPAPSASKR